MQIIVHVAPTFKTEAREHTTSGKNNFWTGEAGLSEQQVKAALALC